MPKSPKRTARKPKFWQGHMRCRDPERLRIAVRVNAFRQSEAASLAQHLINNLSRCGATQFVTEKRQGLARLTRVGNNKCNAVQSRISSGGSCST